jgi:hypothetical protein
MPGKAEVAHAALDRAGAGEYRSGRSSWAVLGKSDGHGLRRRVGGRMPEIGWIMDAENVGLGEQVSKTTMVPGFGVRIGTKFPNEQFVL